MKIILPILLLAAIAVAGCIQTASILDPTTLGNLEGSGMPVKEYGTIVEAVRSNRCDRMTANTVSGSGFVVLIACENNDCTNDQRVKDFLQLGLDEPRSYYDFSYPGGTSRQKVFVGDHGEIDYSRFGGSKKYGIELFPQSGAPNVGDQTCTFSYHVEFERSSSAGDCRTLGCATNNECRLEGSSFVCKPTSVGTQPAPSQPPQNGAVPGAGQPTLLDQIINFINGLAQSIAGLLKR